MCANKQSISECVTLEKEIRRRLDEKWKDAQDRQRSDSKDLSNKLIKLKNEMSLAMLDRNTLDFIRKIKKEWNGVISRSSTYEARLKDMSTKQEGLVQRMNSTMLKIKTMSEEPSSAGRKSEKEVKENFDSSVKEKEDRVEDTQPPLISTNSQPESVQISLEEQKRDEAELKASFKASIKASLHSKAGSSIAARVGVES